MRLYLWGKPEVYWKYQRAVEEAGGTVQFGGSPQTCDGLLLPGGGDLEPWRYGQGNHGSRNLEPERDETELKLLELFVQKERPVLGICRGLQVINVFFGGTLIQDQAGHSAENGVDRLHPVHTSDADLKQVCGETAVVNSAHHQAIDRTGAGLRAVQWAEDGTIEAIRHEALPILALQWHPERVGTPVGSGVFEWFAASGFYRK